MINIMWHYYMKNISVDIGMSVEILPFMAILLRTRHIRLFLFQKSCFEQNLGRNNPLMPGGNKKVTHT